MEVVRIDQEIRVIFYWRRKNQKDTYKPKINYEERNNRIRCQQNSSAMEEFADYYQKTKILK